MGLGPYAADLTGPWASRRDLAVFVGTVLFPLVVFAALAAMVLAGKHGVDTDILRFAQRYYDPSVSRALDETLNGGMVVGALVVVCAVLLLLARKQRAHTLFWILAVGGAVALDLAFKEIFGGRFLGDIGAGFSFPSGNAIASAVVFACTALTCPARWRKTAAVAGVLVVIAYGAALVYEWWHTPSDVVGGWCIAVVWVSVLWHALLRWS
jgi:undecaprenyl-diphosphatase